jgi:hypothetical protein
MAGKALTISASLWRRAVFLFFFAGLRFNCAAFLFDGVAFFFRVGAAFLNPFLIAALSFG